MPSRVSSSGYASSRSQRITWTSNPARASVPASFAIRGSRPAGLFERTKTTRTAMSSQERGDLLRDLLPGRAVAERVRPLPFRAELAADRGADPRGVRPREDVRSDLPGLRPVECEEHVPTAGQAQAGEDVGLLLGDREVLDQGVDHAVPDDVDARRHVLLSKVLPRGGRRREEDVRELIRHDPVQLLGHRLVEGPDPGFDVGQPPFLLLREEGPRAGRVRVPVDDHEVRVLRDAGDLPHRRGDLQVRRLLLQLELLVRLPELHVSEEDPVHHEVVMLTGMHEDMFVVEAVQGLHDRGHLDDFRAGPDDRDDAAHRRRRASNRGPALTVVPRAAQVETIITAPRLRAALLVSVVTTVRNEARNIAALLDSLIVQEPPFEIIVVDSASQDATRDIVRGYERQNESVRLYIFGGTRGAGRNFGIREAKGEAVAFIDGDAIANPFWLKELREGLRHSDVVAGRTIQIGYRPLAMLRQKTNFWSLLRLNTALLGYIGYKFFGKPLPR